MKKILLILFILASLSPAFAGNSDKDKKAKRAITGRVIGENGEPVAGAVLVVKETGENFFTDFNGNYVLSLSPDQVFSITISSIGYQPLVLRSNQILSFSEQNLTPLQ